MLVLILDDPGFDFSVLSEFRQRLLEGQAKMLLLDELLKRCDGGNLGSSSMATITRARCTNLIASLRELASRLISVSSSFVKLRT